MQKHTENQTPKPTTKVKSTHVHAHITGGNSYNDIIIRHKTKNCSDTVYQKLRLSSKQSYSTIKTLNQ